MYFMRFFGSSSVEQVLDAMDYAVYMHDVQHVVLDNLQFMLTGQSEKFDRFELQDRAISEFRHFATHRNVHITIVIHPRKESHLAPLSVSSVFGSAKATQEADNVVILQAPTAPAVQGGMGSDSSGWMRQKVSEEGGEFDKYRRLQVMKNRYDGEVGLIPFVYDRPTGRIQEVDKEGNVKHRAVFARVVPAPVDGQGKRKGRKKGGEGDGEAEEEEAEEAEAIDTSSIGSVFRPAPLFTPPTPPVMQPTLGSQPLAPAVAATRDEENNRDGVEEEEHAVNDERGVLQEERGAVQKAGQGGENVKRWSRRYGDPHRSNPPFEFLA